jgi:protein ImuB
MTMTGTDAAPDAPPLVVAGRERNAFCLAAIDEKATALGLRQGMGLADARAMFPAIEVAESDMAADRLMLEAIASWCDRYTPLVALDLPGGLFLDITGCAHLFGGEAMLMENLAGRLHEQGFHALVGIAPTPGAAWAAARYRSGTILEPGEEEDAFAGLPLGAMRLEGETVAALHKSGLRCVGALAHTPRAPLVRRFGHMVVTRLDQILGHAGEALSPLLPVPERSAERRLSEPVSLIDDIERLIEHLAHKLEEGMEARGEGARRLELALFRVDCAVTRIVVAASRPLRDPRRIRGLFRERLKASGDDIDAGFGFDIVRLSVMESAAMDDIQGDFGGENRHDGGEALATMADRVAARLGPGALTFAMPRQSHVPERAAVHVPFAEAVASLATAQGGALAAAALPERPIRLFEHAEPVEAVAEVPDGPPVRFRWRRALHSVTRAEGPERIGAEWWRDGTDAADRDYYRIEDSDGRRFWIYREGLYGNPGAPPRWYMQGFFP